jgi:hypothetical protein
MTREEVLVTATLVNNLAKGSKSEFNDNSALVNIFYIIVIGKLEVWIQSYLP